MNHPTLCYRKSAVMAVGNYNPEFHNLSEDYDLELRLLRHYGSVVNLPDVLLRYRLHDDQATGNGKPQTPEAQKVRQDIIHLVKSL
jgi:hypothetical protein